MRYWPFLKAGLKRTEAAVGLRFVLVLILTAAPLSGADSYSASYSIGDEGGIVFYYHPESIPETLIKNNINNGHQAEIYASFRIQLRGGAFSIGGEHLEIHVPKDRVP